MTSLFEHAVQLHRDGNLADAESHYRQVLAGQPDHLDAAYLLGTVLLQSGRFDEAVTQLQSVAARRDDVPDVHNNLGVAHKARGDWEAAAKSFQAAVRADPDYHEALFNLGALMDERGLFADARKCYEHALRIEPGDVPTQFGLANTFKQQQNWPEAEDAYRNITNAGERERERNVNLAFVLARQERLDEAAALYRDILAEHPDFAEIHSSLSYVLERQGRLDDAVAAAQTAIELQPELAEGHNNLGIALRSQHRLREAKDAFRKAVERKPDFALAAFNLGTTHLLAGEYSDGWAGYEKRIEALGLSPRSFPQPRWAGEPVPGGRLFVFADQGFGDTIQFARFLQDAKRRSQMKLVLECQPQLVPLLRQLGTVDAVIADGDAPPQFDRWIPLASLSGLLNPNLDGVALSSVPYLQPVGELRRELAESLQAARDERPLCGLVWRGNPEQARDPMRSIPLSILKPVLETGNHQFVSLQTGATAADELAELPPDIRPADLGGELRDFSDTAAVIHELDRLITVDTAAAHLAGAMGADAWTLLCHTPDWRWGLGGESTPWYPRMRLFRQPEWGDWASVVASVVAGLSSVEER
ncbi:MAG: tetratricopeptide repeat protein [Planctomycetaceae bacterium]